MKDSILSIIRKQVLCAMTLGLGVVMFSVSSVAEANPAAAKAIFKGIKITTKTKPIRIPKPTPRPVPTSGSKIIEDYTRIPVPIIIDKIESQRREDEEKKSSQKGLFNR